MNISQTSVEEKISFSRNRMTSFAMQPTPSILGSISILQLSFSSNVAYKAGTSISLAIPSDFQKKNVVSCKSLGLGTTPACNKVDGKEEILITSLVLSDLAKGTPIDVLLEDIVLPYCQGLSRFAVTSSTHDGFEIEAADFSLPSASLGLEQLAIEPVVPSSQATGATNNVQITFTPAVMLAVGSVFKITLPPAVKLINSTNCQVISGLNASASCQLSAPNTYTIQQAVNLLPIAPGQPIKLLLNNLINPKVLGSFPLAIEILNSFACRYSANTVPLPVTTLAALSGIKGTPSSSFLNVYTTYSFEFQPSSVAMENGEFLTLQIPLSFSDEVRCTPESNVIRSMVCQKVSSQEIKINFNIDLALLATSPKFVFKISFLKNPSVAGDANGFIFRLHTVDSQVYETGTASIASFAGSVTPQTAEMSFSSNLRGAQEFSTFSFQVDSFLPQSSVVAIAFSDKFNIEELSVKSSSPELVLLSADPVTRLARFEVKSSVEPLNAISFSLNCRNPIKPTVTSNDIELAVYAGADTEVLTKAAPLKTLTNFICDPVCKDCNDLHSKCTLCRQNEVLKDSKCFLTTPPEPQRIVIMDEVSIPFIFISIGILLALILAFLGLLLKRVLYWANLLYSLLRINFVLALGVFTYYMSRNQDSAWVIIAVYAVWGAHLLVNILGFWILKRNLANSSFELKLSQNQHVNRFVNSSSGVKEKAQSSFGCWFSATLLLSVIFGTSLVRMHYASLRGATGKLFNLDKGSFEGFKSAHQRVQMLYVFLVYIGVIVVISVSLAARIYLFKIEIISLAGFDLLMYTVAYFELNPFSSSRASPAKPPNRAKEQSSVSEHKQGNRRDNEGEHSELAINQSRLGEQSILDEEVGRVCKRKRMHPVALLDLKNMVSPAREGFLAGSPDKYSAKNPSTRVEGSDKRRAGESRDSSEKADQVLMMRREAIAPFETAGKGRLVRAELRDLTKFDARINSVLEIVSSQPEVKTNAGEKQYCFSSVKTRLEDAPSNIAKNEGGSLFSRQPPLQRCLRNPESLYFEIVYEESERKGPVLNEEEAYERRDKLEMYKNPERLFWQSHMGAVYRGKFAPTESNRSVPSLSKSMVGMLGNQSGVKVSPGKKGRQEGQPSKEEEPIATEERYLLEEEEVVGTQIQASTTAGKTNKIKPAKDGSPRIDLLEVADLGGNGTRALAIDAHDVVSKDNEQRILSINNQSIEDIRNAVIRDGVREAIDLKVQEPAMMERGLLTDSLGRKIFINFEDLDMLRKGMFNSQDGRKMVVTDQLFKEMETGIVKNADGEVIEINGQRIEDFNRKVVVLKDGIEISLEKQKEHLLQNGIIMGDKGAMAKLPKGQKMEDFERGVFVDSDGNRVRLIDQTYQDLKEGTFRDFKNRLMMEPGAPRKRNKANFNNFLEKDDSDPFKNEKLRTKLKNNDNSKIGVAKRLKDNEETKSELHIARDLGGCDPEERMEEARDRGGYLEAENGANRRKGELRRRDLDDDLSSKFQKPSEYMGLRMENESSNMSFQPEGAQLGLRLGALPHTRGTSFAVANETANYAQEHNRSNFENPKGEQPRGKPGKEFAHPFADITEENQKKITKKAIELRNSQKELPKKYPSVSNRKVNNLIVGGTGEPLWERDGERRLQTPEEHEEQQELSLQSNGDGNAEEGGKERPAGGEDGEERQESRGRSARRKQAKREEKLEQLKDIYIDGSPA
jgi:hypothetical protein